MTRTQVENCLATVRQALRDPAAQFDITELVELELCVRDRRQQEQSKYLRQQFIKKVAVQLSKLSKASAT